MKAGLPQSLRARLNPAERFGLRVTLLIVAFVLVAVPFATLTFQVLAKGALTRLDGSLANHLNDWVRDHSWVVKVLEAISWLGRPPWLAFVIGVGSIYAWRRGRRRLVAFLVVTSVGGGLVDSAVKLLVNRPRPIVDHPVQTAFGKSFPSGHSMSSMVCYGALLLVFLPVIPRARRAIAVGLTLSLVLTIGTSRLFLGVHFVSDVIGGFVLGLAWLVGMVALFEVWRVEEGRAPTSPLAQGLEPEAASALKR
ncbi:MAG TPA: phosphatase PAP2 family protein [Acidimicrobiales bacterium]|nr:phosphatase PAP2 family protein [Acidimicrobiales bacterium]